MEGRVEGIYGDRNSGSILRYSVPLLYEQF